MANYQEARVELTNTKLNKSKSAAKNKIGTAIRLNQKNLLREHEELPHELFLTTKETSKIRNAFANNMSADIGLSKIQICDIIQSGGSCGSIPLARDSLPGLVSNLISNAINKFERKNKWKRSCKSSKGIYFIYFE